MDGHLGPDLVVFGRLHGTSDLRIDGRLEGELVIEGKVSVGAGGRVSAPLTVTDLDVEGEVRGPVRASAVNIRAGGRLEGDVAAQSIAIDDGGSLHGGILMDFELADGEPE